ncbi:MAG: hypothetical protein ACO3QS_06430 [Burkholderiaceae bacterium]
MAVVIGGGFVLPYVRYHPKAAAAYSQQQARRQSLNTIIENFTMATTAKSKTQGQEEAICIQKPDFRLLEINIQGTSPLVINRFSAKAMEQMRTTQEAGSTARGKKVREAKDFNALFENAKHVANDGWEGIHAAAFRNGAISACRTVGVRMTHAKLAFSVLADGYDQVDGAPLVRITKGKAEPWTAPTRNATGVIDLRCRPMYKEWAAILRIKYDAGMFTATDLVNLISRVGFQVGIGEGRPDSKNSAGLGFGLFEIV